MKRQTIIQLDTRAEKQIMALAARSVGLADTDDPTIWDGYEARQIRNFAQGTELKPEQLQAAKRGLERIIEHCESHSRPEDWEEVVPGEGASGVIRDHGEMRKVLAESRQMQGREAREALALVEASLGMCYDV